MQFYIRTGGAAVSGATVSTTSSTYTRVRSGDITSNLTDNEEYTVRLTRDATGGTAYIKAARLVIVQNASPIQDTKTAIELGNKDEMFGARVQRGTESISGGTTSSTETVASVDTNRSFLICAPGENATNGPDDLTYTCELTNSTTITFARPSGNAGTLTIRWQLIEYDNIRVQASQVSMSATSGSTSYTIPTAVDTAKTFMTLTVRSDSIDNAENIDRYVSANITTSTNVDFARAQTAGNVDVEFFIVEFLDETYVEQWSGLSIPDTSSSDTATISGPGGSGVDTARSFLIGYTQGNTSSGMDDLAVTIELTNATTVTATKAGTAGVNTIEGWVIELPQEGSGDNGAMVEQASQGDLSASPTNITLTNSFDQNRSFVWGSATESGTGSSWDRTDLGFQLTSPTNFQLTTDDTGNTDTFEGFAVQLPDWRTVTDPKIYNFDSSKFSSTLTANFEGTLRSNQATASAQLRLYNITDNEAVTSSAITVSGTTWDRQVSSSLTIGASVGNLQTGDEYVVQLDYVSGVEAQIANAKLVLSQNNAGGLASMEIIHSYVNTLATDTDSTYTAQDFDNSFDDDNFSGGTFTYRNECTLKSSAGTGYCDTFDGTSQITNSEVTTDGTDDNDYDRIRSSSDLSGMPTAATNLDTRVRNSAASGNTTSVSNSWLVITVTGLGSGGGSGTNPDWKTPDMCISENCLFYDGTADMAEAANDDSIDMDRHLASGLTFQGWFRANSDGESNVGQIFNKGTNTYARITNEGTDSLADLEVKIDLATTDEDVKFTNAITLNKWHFIAVGYTDDGDDEATVYLDSLAITPSTDANADGAPETDANNLLIGGASTANFHGFIDEFKIYDEERTAAQVKTDYIRGTSSLHGTSSAQGIREYYSLSDGLVGYWKMDEATNNDRLDSSGNGNTLTESTGDDIDGNTGKFSLAADFEDTDTEYLTITDASQTGLEFDGDYTVNLWVNFEDKNQNSMFISKGAGVTDPFAQIGWVWEGAGPYKLYARHWEGSGEAETSSFDRDDITDGVWYMMTVAYDDNTDEVIFCLNGICDPPDIMSNEMGNNSADILFGQSQSANYLDGKMDEFRVYNRAFTPSEVDFLYNWAPGPLGYWSFDEGTGTSTAYDRSGNENNGTMQGSMTEDDWVPGKFGSALDFDGSNDEVILPSEIIGDSAAFTISAWMKMGADTADQRTIYGEGDTATTEYFFLYISDSGSTLNYYSLTGATSTSLNGTSNVEDNLWHFVTVVQRSKTDRELYVDGVSEDTDTASAGTFTLDTASIGFLRTDWTADPFLGRLDEVRAYNYARTQSQIIEDMNAGHPAPGSPVGTPLGHWQFDEGYGDTANDIGTGGNNGDLAGGTTCPQAGDSACPTWTNSGKFDKALDFDLAGATDDHVQTSSNELATANEFTMTTWFKTDSTAAHKLILWQGDVIANGYGNGSMNEQEAHFSIGNYIGSDVNDKITFFLGDTDETNDAGVLHISVDFTDTTNWHHLAGVVKNLSTSPESEFYIDGVLVGTDTGTTTRTSRTNWDTNLRIGRPGADWRQFDGQIDEVKVYNFALTADQVKGDMNYSSASSFGNVADQNYEGFGGNAPIAWWKMDDNTDNTCNATDDVCDTSGNDNHGAKTNMTEGDWVPGKVGSTLDFDGNNDYVQVSDSTSLDSISSAFTISVWVYPRTIANLDYVFWKSDDAPGIRSSGGTQWQVVMNSAGTDSVTGTSGIQLNEWTNITEWYDGTNLRLYINGIEEGTPDSVPSFTPGGDVIIGRDNTSGREFDGFIDELRIYNYARSPAQIAYDFNRGGPIGYWQLDECSGTTANDAGFGGNNGTITAGDTSGSNDSVGTCSSGAGDEMWDNGTTGKRNASLDFDGTNDYATIANESDFDFERTDTFSVSAWINPDDWDSQGIVNKAEGSGDIRGWALNLADSFGTPRVDEVGFALRNSSSSNLQVRTQKDFTGSAGTWLHVAATYDGSSAPSGINIYVNGVNEPHYSIDDTLSSTILQNISPQISGRGGANFLFDGQIDEVKIFNYVLTADQIKRDFNYGAQFFGPNTGSP